MWRQRNVLYRYISVNVLSKASVDSKIIFGCIYIPPENSKYSSEDAFVEIEDELALFSQNNKNISLILVILIHGVVN